MKKQRLTKYRKNKKYESLRIFNLGAFSTKVSFANRLPIHNSVQNLDRNTLASDNFCENFTSKRS
jgi:hypothetical protein